MHFVYKNKLSTSTDTVNKIIFTVYNWLFDVYKDYNVMAKRGLQPADIFQKLYETAITTMNAHYKTNKILWEMSSIRGFCPTINANDAIDIVIMQVIPKYTFKGNVISYNISSIRNNIKELFLSVLRAREKLFIRENDIGKSFDVFNNFGNIHDIGYVDSASADKYSDARFFA